MAWALLNVWLDAVLVSKENTLFQIIQFLKIWEQ